VDSTFSFLSGEHAQRLNDILSRRNAVLLRRINISQVVSRSDAEEIILTLAEEFINNLDDDWEPTGYGREVDSILGRVNAALIEEWPR
jgi:hypothetical protein